MFFFSFPERKKNKILTVLDSFCSKVEREREIQGCTLIWRERERDDETGITNS